MSVMIPSMSSGKIDSRLDYASLSASIIKVTSELKWRLDQCLKNFNEVTARGTTFIAGESKWTEEQAQSVWNDLNAEQVDMWERFPRNSPIYGTLLAQIAKLMAQEGHYRREEVRDVDTLVH